MIPVVSTSHRNGVLARAENHALKGMPSVFRATARWLCLFAWAAGLSSCARPARRDPPAAPSLKSIPAAGTSATDPADLDDADDHRELSVEQLRAMGAQEARIDSGTSPILITYADVDEMSESLRQYLASARSSELKQRDYLITSANGAGFIDAQGTVRLGPWVLDPNSNPLVLRFRLPHEETARLIFAYVATLTHDDRWHVESVRLETIRRR